MPYAAYSNAAACLGQQSWNSPLRARGNSDGRDYSGTMARVPRPGSSLAITEYGGQRRGPSRIVIDGLFMPQAKAACGGAQRMVGDLHGCIRCTVRGGRVLLLLILSVRSGGRHGVVFLRRAGGRAWKLADEAQACGFGFFEASWRFAAVGSHC